MPIHVIWRAYQAAELDLDAKFRTFGGSVWYEQCVFAGRTVRLSRLQTLEGMRLRQINRYIDPESLLQLELSEAIVKQLIDSGLKTGPLPNIYR